MTASRTQKQGIFFSEHHRWLLQRVRGQLNSRLDAEDTAAETFLQILASRVDPDSIVQPRAYLLTIAQRLIYKVYRRQRFEAAYRDRMAAMSEDLAPSAEDAAIIMEALMALDRVLAGLPIPVKRAFLYSQLDGFKYDEIARRLDVSERTVGRYMAEALRHCLLGGVRL